MKRGKQEPLIYRIKMYHFIVQYILLVIIGAALYYNFIDAFIPNAIMVGVLFAVSIQILEMFIIPFIGSFNEKN
jgi:hypothetical protein